MRKILVVFVVLGGISFISSCAKQDKECRCFKQYSGPGSEDYTNGEYTEFIYSNTHCSDVLDKVTTYDSGLTETVWCWGV
ncbi:MAG: hypothetical protein GQ574_23155 [Crocinitomix sp.]|nr:hypothetical protein [Crocinitomix sp.]